MQSCMDRCPYCNKDLGDATEEYRSKHTMRCSTRLNPYIYSDRGRGRPSNEEKRRALKLMGRL